jgi:hypothetical protein
VRQTVLSVVLEVQPESAGTLASLVEKLKRDEENLCLGITESYDRLKLGVPSLHFMSMSVFPGADYDPIFVIEVNFDGPAGPFWAQFEATLEPYLRAMLRCCKRPGDSGGPLYDAITADKSRYPLAPYLEGRTLKPSVFHQGNRGLARERILQEGELFKATRSELADTGAVNPYRGISEEQIHQKLRNALLDRFRWLDLPASTRIPMAERAADVGRLLGFLLIALFALAIPGLLLLVFLRAFFPDGVHWFLALDLGRFLLLLLLLLIVPALAALPLYETRAARPGEAAPTNSGGLTLSTKNEFTSLANPITLFPVVIIVLGIIVVAVAVVGAAAMSFVEVFSPAFSHTSEVFNQAMRDGFFHALFGALKTFHQAFHQSVLSFVPTFLHAFGQNCGPVFRLVAVAIYTVLVLSIPAILLWLRWLERRDSHQDAPPIDQRELRKMTHREDWIPQNHMGSVVLVKPGMLRAALFRAGHLGLGLVIRVIVTDGYLGSMRTIHFAHWAFVNNGSRLMFFSNFDHSWDSYLDDFIEKAHGGLTLAWGSGVGFPPTRFLVLDGASHGRQFKAWARHSMAVSRFWFSAYKDYTVDQIERHARIADGLRKTSLQPEEAIAWAQDL